MCLIAYSSKGKMIDRSILAYAYNQNPDGIGVMSLCGIEKFMGKKALKRARRYLETYLAPEEIPFAIHFRWATHGDIKLANTHPYEAPTGLHWIMHNGIISLTTQESSADESDTAVYVRKFMQNAPPLSDVAYYAQLERHIGWANKFCIMDSNGTFILCNEDAGTWIDDIWFSNTYSLPAHKVPDRWANYGGYYHQRSGYTYIPREMWDKEQGKMIPNPDYKETVPVTAARTQDPYLLPRPKAQENERWNTEDRRSYYEALEAGLTVDAEYYDAGTTIGETAAKMAELDKLEDHPIEMCGKEEALIGGDFAPEEDHEEQNRFRVYLKRVAAGIYSS